jgi:RNA polymerase sigma-70 factor, ECF subfamily
MKDSLLSDIYTKFSTPILRFILKRNGGDLEAAQEVVQETFVSVIKSFHTFHHKSTYFTWLCKIALNKLADYYRKQVHTRSRVFVPSIEQFNRIIDPSISPEEKISLNELHSNVSRCLNMLPNQYRQLLHLKYYLELSNTQICLRLGLSPRKLEGRLYRARHSLAKVISKTHPELQN